MLYVARQADPAALLQVARSIYISVVCCTAGDLLATALGRRPVHAAPLATAGTSSTTKWVVWTQDVSSECSALRHELAAVKTALHLSETTHRETIQSLQRTCAQLDTELSAARNGGSRQDAEYATMKAEIEDNATALSASRAELETARRVIQHQLLRIEEASHRSRSDQLRAESAEAELVRHTEQLAVAEAAREQAAASAAESAAELSAKCAELGAARSATETVQADLHQLRAELDAAEGTLRERQDELCAVRAAHAAALQAASAAHEALQAEAAQQLAEVAAVRAQLQQQEREAAERVRAQEQSERALQSRADALHEALQSSEQRAAALEESLRLRTDELKEAVARAEIMTARASEGERRSVHEQQRLSEERQQIVASVRSSEGALLHAEHERYVARQELQWEREAAADLRQCLSRAESELVSRR